MKLSPLAIVLASLLPSAAADPPETRRRATIRPPKARAARPTAARPRPPAQPRRRYDFEGDTIDAGRLQPDGTTVFGIRGPTFGRLLVLRGDFLSEIIRDADGR